MLPALEYLHRTGELYNSFEVPCSLFITTPTQCTKIVITINEGYGWNGNSDRYVVRHWFLSSCQDDKFLPTVSDYLVDKSEIFSDKSTIISGLIPLRYYGSGVRLSKNIGNGGHPMRGELYRDYIETLLCSRYHQTKKEAWLWEAFAKTYFGASAEYIIGKQEYIKNGKYSLSRLPNRRTLIRQQKIVERHFKNNWRTWKLWKKHMLPNEKIATELVFSFIYQQ